jgi:hypothetical protein
MSSALGLDERHIEQKQNVRLRAISARPWSGVMAARGWGAAGLRNMLETGSEAHAKAADDGDDSWTEEDEVGGSVRRSTRPTLM